LSGDNDIGSDGWSGRDITPGQGNSEAPSQPDETLQKSIHPFLREPRGQAEREKTCQRLASHGGKIAQTAQQTAVSYACRRMPWAAKVYVFNTEIGRDQKLMSGRDFEDGAVIANAAYQARAATFPGQSLDAFD
jgi:hypothetical protein